MKRNKKQSKKGRKINRRPVKHHPHSHNRPINHIIGKSVVKRFQYSGGWFGYKGRNRVFVKMTFYRKNFRK